MFKRQRLPIGIGDPVNGLKEQEIKDDLNNHEHNGTNIEHIRWTQAMSYACLLCVNTFYDLCESDW